MEPLQLSLDHPELDEQLSRAYLRVEQYLCALRIHNKRILSELTHAILGDVRKRILAGDQRVAVDIAMEAIDQHVRAWFNSITGVGEGQESRDQIRLSLFRSDLARQWSRYFLRSGDIPESVLQQMRERTLHAHPESATGESMQPEQLDLGTVGRWAEDTWRLFGKWPILGGMVLGVIYLLVVAFLVYFASL